MGALCWLLMIGACGGAPRQSDIRIGALNGPGGLSLVKLMQDHADDAEYPEIRYMIKSDPTLIKAMMSREALDLALVPLTTGALLYNSGLQYQLIVVPVWGSLYLAGKDSSIHEIDDLRGKHIYMMAKNMTPDILFRQILWMCGLEPDIDLTLDYTFPTPTELASAMQADRVPLGLVSEPMMSHILNENEDLHLLLDLTDIWCALHPEGPPLAQTAVMVRKSWAAENPLLLNNWCAQYAASVAWINMHPDSAGVLAEDLNLVRRAEVASSAIKRSRLDYQYASSKRREILEYLEVIYRRNPRVIGNRLPNEDFFYAQ
jgi:NitT/TauT family transport system substrate-binding protein